MTLTKYFCFIFAMTACAFAVKVDMQGTLSLGSDVLDALTHFFRRSAAGPDGRRSMSNQADYISLEVISSALCRKIDFCSGTLYQFINEYVIALAKVTENVFDGIHNIKAEEKLEAATPVFGKLKGALRDVRKILKSANEKVKDNNEDYMWVSVIKKISAKFQTKTIAYIVDKLDTDPSQDVIKKNLTQKLVIRIAETELLHQKKLCQNHRICLRSVEFTKSLNSILELLAALPDSRVKSFIRSFYELLPDTNLYKRLNQVTANEFQIILNDMAFADYVPTKDILNTVQKIVATRLNTIFKKEEVTNPGHDLTLLHVIMSDMDFFYSKMKPEPFTDFFNGFLEWTRTGGRVNPFLKGAITNVESVLHGVSEELIAKLTYEVRVFLELTVDPEHPI